MVKNGLAEFQKIMNQMLVNFNFAKCYIDDNIIFSPTFGDHMHNLQQVFGRLKEHNLKFHLGKC
jgi:hypothetical protein